MKTIHKEAIKVIETITKRREKYDKINDDIRVLQPEFSSYLHVMDNDCEVAVVGLLDYILGDSDLASYFIYECHTKPPHGHGLIQVEGREYKLRTIEELKNYVEKELSD